MTQIYEIWERQADRYYEMKKYLDETDKKVDRVQDRILYNDLKLIALRFSISIIFYIRQLHSLPVPVTVFVLDRVVFLHTKNSLKSIRNIFPQKSVLSLIVNKLLLAITV